MALMLLTWITVAFYVFPVCFACFIDQALSGSVTHSNKDTYDLRAYCQIIEVPKGSYVRLQLISFDFSQDCPDMYLEIAVAVTNETFRLCRRTTRYWDQYKALNNVTITYRHGGSGWYRKSSFHLTYFKESIMCTRQNHFRCSEHECIHEDKVCNRVDDCKYGEDEMACDRGVAAVPRANVTRENAINWLKSRRAVTYGWGKDTHRAITALYLSRAAYFHGDDLEEELMAKQLELRASVALLRNSTDPISISELSMFVNALMVTCHNPRQFYGYDLVQILYDRVSVTNIPCPGAYLTLCNSNWVFSESDISRLLEILHKSSEHPFILDIQAVTVMALTCIKSKKEDYKKQIDSSGSYNATIEKFVQSQLSDGSFGNVYTTSLITQVLISSEEEINEQWNVTATANYLVEQLNSSSVDFLSIYLALPTFSGRSLLDIGKVNCVNSYRKQEGSLALVFRISPDLVSLNNVDNMLVKQGKTSSPSSKEPASDPFLRPLGSEISDVMERLGGKMFIQYSLYIGDSKEIIHTLYLKMPENSSAYDVMRVAQMTDHKYKFLHRYMSDRLYVYEIAGIINDPEAGKFWLLYKNNDIKNTIKLHTESPDNFILKDGDHLIMWYKVAHI